MLIAETERLRIRWLTVGDAEFIYRLSDPKKRWAPLAGNVFVSFLLRRS